MKVWHWWFIRGNVITSYDNRRLTEVVANPVVGGPAPPQSEISH